MYANDRAYLSAKSLQTICNHVSTVIEEYVLKVSEKKSTVVCINGIRGIGRWKIGSTIIDETEEYKYLFCFTKLLKRFGTNALRRRLC